MTLKVGDKVKVIKGDYTAWQGEVLALCGSSWVAVHIHFRDTHGNITVPPDFLQVIEPAKAFLDPEQWEYYSPVGEDDA